MLSNKYKRVSEIVPQRQLFLPSFLLEIAICYILSCIAGNAWAQATNRGPEDINSLIPLIEAAETESFDNLKIETVGWVETKSNMSDPCELWNRTPVSWSCSAWISGNDREIKRVDFHEQVVRGSEGSEPYLRESFSVCFDGKHGKHIRHSTGSLQKSSPIKEGILLPHPPKQLNSRWLQMCTGERYSVSRFFSNSEQSQPSLSQFFSAATTKQALEKGAFEVKVEDFEGVECLKFGSGEQTWGHETWWLDPSRGFSLMGYERINTRDGNKILISRIIVTKLEKIGPNAWWPAEATSITAPVPIKDRQPLYSRTVYRTVKLTANDPNFDDSIFTVPFPEGYLIDDQVAGRKYKVGEE